MLDLSLGPKSKFLSFEYSERLFSIKLFNLSGFAAGVFLIQCAMPSAVLTYLIGSMYSPKKIVDSIASMIVVSTIMSFITLPIVVFFALKYFY